jgi:hypothetical protein
MSSFLGITERKDQMEIPLLAYSLEVLKGKK